MKLFKKVAAAVLAGVMALSMVACGSTTPTVDPGNTETPTTSTVDSVLYYMNYYRNGDNALIEAEPIVNDAALAARAQAFLTLMQANPMSDNLHATWTGAAGTTTGSAVVSEQDVRDLLHLNAGVALGNVHVIETVNGVANVKYIAPVANNGVNEYTFTTTDRRYTMDNNVKRQLAAAGWNIQNATATNKIGIASGNVNGVECVIIVTEAGFNTTAAGGALPITPVPFV